MASVIFVRSIIFRWDHVCWRGQQNKQCAWLKTVTVSQTVKRGSAGGLGAPADTVASLPPRSCSSPGVWRAQGLPWVLLAGYLQLLFGCSASAAPSFTVFTAMCLTQLWSERAFIYFALHFSLLAWWQSVSPARAKTGCVFLCTTSGCHPFASDFNFKGCSLNLPKCYRE